MTTQPAGIAEVLAAHEQRLNALEADYITLHKKHQELVKQHDELIEQIDCAFTILAYLRDHEVFDAADFNNEKNYSFHTIELALIMLSGYHPAADAALKKIDPVAYA